MRTFDLKHTNSLGRIRSLEKAGPYDGQRLIIRRPEVLGSVTSFIIFFYIYVYT